MKHDFDKVIDRRNTNSVKYDFAAECGMPEDVLPLWVADMDFQAPEAVRQRLAEISRFGVYGYSNSRDDYFAAVQKWYSTHFSWKPKKEWLVKTPGVVFAIAAAIRAFTEPGDGVMIQQPVYYPFRNTILANDRECVNSPLVLEDGRYRMDLDDMEQKIREHDVKLFILCSPHNPVGRVWTKDELAAAGRLCEKYDVLIVSDEIHSDFYIWGSDPYGVSIDFPAAGRADDLMYSTKQDFQSGWTAGLQYFCSRSETEASHAQSNRSDGLR